MGFSIRRVVRGKACNSLLTSTGKELDWHVLDNHAGPDSRHSDLCKVGPKLPEQNGSKLYPLCTGANAYTGCKQWRIRPSLNVLDWSQETTFQHACMYHASLGTFPRPPGLVSDFIPLCFIISCLWAWKDSLSTCVRLLIPAMCWEKAL